MLEKHAEENIKMIGGISKHKCCYLKIYSFFCLFAHQHCLFVRAPLYMCADKSTKKNSHSDEIVKIRFHSKMDNDSF